MAINPTGSHLNMAETTLKADAADSSSSTPEKGSPSDPLQQRASLMAERLELLPLDQLRNIITSQLDLEIRLKHRELEVASANISKAELQLHVLEQFLGTAPAGVSGSDTPELTAQYANALQLNLNFKFNELQGLPSVPPTFNLDCFNDQGHGAPLLKLSIDGDVRPNGHVYRTRSTTSSLRPSSYSGASSLLMGNSLAYTGCLYRRSDGVVVRLTCPDCLRTNFSLAQGFLNHSRIAHSTEYGSQDEAALKCGEVLPSTAQDAEGNLAITALRAKNLDPNTHLSVGEAPRDTRLVSPLSTLHVQEEKDVKDPIAVTANPKPRSTQLLRKVARNGLDITEYKAFFDDASKPVTNAHLFDGEIDETDDHDCEPASVVDGIKTRAKRRKSRGGININFPSIVVEDDQSLPKKPKP